MGIKKYVVKFVFVALFVTAVVSIALNFLHLRRIEKLKVMSENLFPILGPDREWMKEEVCFYIHISPDLPLIDKLRIIADKLSSFMFSDLPIEVVEIKEKNNKLIAVVNLKEISPAVPNLPSWGRGYFQGSTGGYFTTIILKENFLQRNYTGKWIDGVEFLYENIPIKEGDWDHISLYGTIYRK